MSGVAGWKKYGRRVRQQKLSSYVRIDAIRCMRRQELLSHGVWDGISVRDDRFCCLRHIGSRNNVQDDSFCRLRSVEAATSHESTLPVVSDSSESCNNVRVNTSVVSDPLKLQQRASQHFLSSQTRRRTRQSCNNVRDDTSCCLRVQVRIIAIRTRGLPIVITDLLELDSPSVRFSSVGYSPESCFLLVNIDPSTYNSEIYIQLLNQRSLVL